MVQDIKEEIYEVNEKRYKVVTKCIENSKSANKIYDILCNLVYRLDEELFSRVQSKRNINKSIRKNMNVN